MLRCVEACRFSHDHRVQRKHQLCRRVLCVYAVKLFQSSRPGFRLTSIGRFSTIRLMIKLVDQMRELIDNALANGSPCILATASSDGEPDIGYKGSMMVFDNESLAYWERTKRGHLK